MKNKIQMKQVISIIGMLIFMFISVLGMISESVDVIELITRLLLVSVVLLLMGYLFKTYYEQKFISNHMYVMYWIFVFIGFIPSIFLVSVNMYILPLLLTTALVSTRINSRLGIMTHFMLTFIFLMITSIPIEVYMVYVVTGLFIAYAMPYVKQRNQMVYVAVSTAVLMMFLVLIGHLMRFGGIEGFPFSSFLLAGGNGLLLIVLAEGSGPMWEALFRIDSQATLIELTSVTQPLLKQLQVEAPGTYHHSMMVALLAEKATMDIQGNHQLAKAGGMYHDIGKMVEKTYFSENQEGKNIHDDLAPDASAHYIIQHVENGMALAIEYKLPKAVQEIIQEHHGDSVVAYFYNRAVEHSDGFDISLEPFQYKGPKPKTKESAIVMLADCVEAGIRGLKWTFNGQEELVEEIEKIVKTVMNKEQLNACPLKCSELPVIVQSFAQVYRGIDHERVYYNRELMKP